MSDFSYYAVLQMEWELMLVKKTLFLCHILVLYHYDNLEVMLPNMLGISQLGFPVASPSLSMFYELFFHAIHMLEEYCLEDVIIIK